MLKNSGGFLHKSQECRGNGLGMQGKEWLPLEVFLERKQAC